MEQNLQTFEAALKDIYLPAWRNQLSTEPSAFLAAIKSTKLEGHTVKSAAPVGFSGGFGYGAEGQPTPTAGGINYMNFELPSKDMYVEVAISAKTVRLGKTPGAMVNALDAEIKGAYEAAKWNVGRSLFGNGVGVLAEVVAQTSASAVVEVKEYKYLKEGLTVDFYTGSVDEATPTAKAKRILWINRTKNDKGNYEITLDSAHTSAIGAGFMTVQQSFKREITGLGAIMDDNVLTLYGKEKAKTPIIKPIVVDAEESVEESHITGGLRLASNEKNNKVNMLLCGDAAYDAYAEFLRTNNLRYETGTLKGGFKSIKFLFGDTEVDMVNERFVPDGEMWGVNTSDFEFQNTNWNFQQLQGGGIFNLKENSSVYRALMANYGELICQNPGGCVRIKNCVPA